MKPLNIAVLGGSGYIMRQVLYEGAKKGHRMVCVDMKAPEFTWNDQMFVKANLSSEESTKKAFESVEKQLKENGFGEHIDAVANGIAVLSYTKSVRDLYGPNVLTARNVAQYCSFNDIFLLHMSGVAVQGVNNPLPLREEYPLDPIEPYGITKALSELEVFNEIKRNMMSAIILRANAVIGPECLDTMILQMFETAKNGPFVPRPETLNSYINTIDIGKAVIFAMEKQDMFDDMHSSLWMDKMKKIELSDFVYNICDKEPITDGQAFDYLMKIMPPKKILGMSLRFKTSAPSSKYALRTLGLLTEAAARLTNTKPVMPYNLAKLAHVGHAQSREKFKKVFEGKGFEMTFNSTYESLDYVVDWLKKNHWK